MYHTNDPLDSEQLDKDIQSLCNEYQKYNYIDPRNYDIYNVKRGLRNPDGTGVMAGVTQICNVHGYVIIDGEKAPADGILTYRGISVTDLVQHCLAEDRFGFEETIWLLLFGQLPTRDQIQKLRDMLAFYRSLDEDFVDDMIIKAPSKDIMNKLASAVLALYSLDDNPDDLSLSNLIRQSIMLIARIPTITVAAYQVRRRSYNHKSMYFHQPKAEFSIAENILRTMRSDKQFTHAEAQLLDLCLILHADHGGGNNSTFATRVLSSTGTDTYSAIAAGIGSLKGPKHGGANHKVMEMLEYIKENVSDWNNDQEIQDYLTKIIRKEAGDRSGLVYGMGHAVYTKSDPRAIILKENAIRLAKGTEFEAEFKLLDAVERLTPQIFAEIKGDSKVICANVDLYSGLVYKMLRLPPEIYTPLFATARAAGWCAHRIEEIMFGGRLMRPAYKALTTFHKYVPLNERG